LSNHSKKPNAFYSMVDHPRFGRIRNIVAMTDLNEGDEILCDYGYIDQYNK
jgi:SET domain-containing protein